jgi:hypothetical protein
MKIRLVASSDASAVANLTFQSFLEYRTGNRGTTPGSSRELRLRKRLHALGSEHDSTYVGYLIPGSISPPRLTPAIHIALLHRRSYGCGWDHYRHILRHQEDPKD